MSQHDKPTDSGDSTAQEDAVEKVYHHNEAENLPVHSHRDDEVLSEANLQAYWRANIKVLVTLLSLWAFVSLICGIVLGEWLDQFYIGGFPLGFWFTQQGAMLCFVAIIFVYHFWMLRIERRYGVDDDDDHTNKKPSAQRDN